ncbi:UDP-N-acetylglucosamine 2-epimerase (non-hydrolyzing) [Puniceicoccales bacterium CK1056]|uniref:UDP-N-acetylglucosamine 2-epimerase (non-hydrolyzing) n=1 Tax=Oceanipulchritudo coccoides TaxID=2706888 RepID=A0A6B2M479_9BACT|nr:UDP-N-acetylglucosamine 2-epimerase (non-hydrolyzing) [Oceanipulchritudo coccoides]
MKRVAVVAGTRPEAIKMAPVYFALKKSKTLEPVFLSTAQHRQMLDQAVGVFGIQPEFDLDLMQHGQTLPELTGRVINAVTEFIEKENPDAMLVQGDTTTVLASSIAAFYASVPVGHVEAGLRTGNMRSPFPEEMNRKLTTPLARWNFCPTETSRKNLLKEGIDPKTISVTGNTVIDALLWMRERLRKDGIPALEVAERCGIPETFCTKFMRSGKTNGRFILVTGHRRESFGHGFENICHSVAELTKQYPDVGILYPVHLNPRVQEPVRRILGGNANVTLIEPVGYRDFIWLMDRSFFVLSDSGGVQEEAPSLGKPVLVMRETTERPEGVEAGTCRLVGTDPDTILAEAKLLLENDAEYQRRSSLQNPYGDGKSAAQIARILEETI